MRFKSITIVYFSIFLIGLFSGCLDQKTDQEIELTILGVWGETKELKLAEIMEFQSISGLSEFQNFFGNWRGKGVYTGVPISTFAEEVGGIQKGDILVVTSEDNYTQIYTYENIYPTTEWEEIQGRMILAYEFNGTQFPTWDDGLQIVFLPSDGQYSNEDSKATSSLESKGSPAGARWSKYIKKLEFRRENETVTFGYNSNNYTLSWSQVLRLPSINESGSFKTGVSDISDPDFYTGVNLTYTLDLLIDINQNFSITIVAADSYSRTFSRDLFFGNTTLYDSSGNELGFNDPENVNLILAYYEGGQKLISEDGPFRAVYVGPNSPITGSAYWVRSVVYIEIDID
ncbi:MAG: hypothetical protein JSV04_06435 [Candidatus Heimdallarchaeota archaeon]|nr:MAG: hypothetical protein JSV04_06435 [Candidatus Heimdallarchaeota archaeon]